jgi:hypothetical protein
MTEGDTFMNKTAYPLKLPASVKSAAQQLAREDGVSLNQWIAVAVAEKIGAVETAAAFLRRRAGRPRSTSRLIAFPRQSERRDATCWR